MHCDYKTRDEARASLFDYMEVFYNRQRRHSTIKYVAPLVIEASTTAQTGCPLNVGNFSNRPSLDGLLPNQGRPSGIGLGGRSALLAALGAVR
jgi:hypothetical protein